MLTVALAVVAWLLIVCAGVVFCAAAAIGDEQMSRTRRDPRGPP